MKFELHPTLLNDDGTEVPIGTRIHDEEWGNFGTYAGAKRDEAGDWRFGIKRLGGEVDWYWKGRALFWRIADGDDPPNDAISTVVTLVPITEELLQAGASRRGAWSRAQMEVLGVKWPLKRGWKRHVIGATISYAAAERFVTLKNVHLSKHGSALRNVEVG